MNWGLLLKLLPFIQGFIPKSSVPLIALGGITCWLLIGYVDAKHEQVTLKISTQKDQVSTEIKNQAQLTNLQLAQVTSILKDVKTAIQRNNDKIFEAVNRIQTN